MVKAHIGSAILTFIVQDTQNNIQPASDSNSESESDSDVVGRIVGSGGNSSELNDSGDQTADSQQEREAEERYLSLVRLDTGRKEQESSEKTMCHGIIYMENCNLEPIIKHQIKSK